jgi:hypothetical protein
VYGQIYTGSNEGNKKRVIKFLIDTKQYDIRLQPKSNTESSNEWNMITYSDSDRASDKGNRKSVTGFSIFLNGAPLLWKSQGQKTVSLSSTEAEYYALSEAEKEIKILTQVLESLNLNVRKPIVVHLDNVGAIFLAETQSATKHTRHIDACYHFDSEFIIDGEIQIIFVSTKENKSDMLTKNVTSDVYDAHIDSYK